MTVRFTPEQITELGPDEVFVFGSNAAGRHGGGAARFGFERFGAEWGVGEGLTGRCYALPTMGSDAETAAAVERFLAVAESSADLTFLVTKIGTGIAGRPVEVIAPMFARRLPNVILPPEFFNALGGNQVCGLCGWASHEPSTSANWRDFERSWEVHLRQLCPKRAGA